MLLPHTFFGACALFGSGLALKKPQSPIADIATSCDVVKLGAGAQCTFYTQDPTSGKNRTTLLAFPQDWSPQQVGLKPYPLILSFHGRSKNSAEQQLLTGLSGNNISAFAAYPQGINNEWQGDPRASTNDTAFVTLLIDSLLARSDYGITPTQVYATGKSNGGGFMNIMACDPHLSSTIAAFAAVSGAFYVNGTGSPGLVLPTCSPNVTLRAIPFMEFHGTSDCMIRYDGGLNHEKTATTQPVFNVVEYWASQQNCMANSVTTVGSCGIERYSWNCNEVTDTVVHYKIPSLMHCWPNVDGNDDCPDPNVVDTRCMHGYCNTCIEATPIILDWLQNFSIPPKELNLRPEDSPEKEL